MLMLLVSVFVGVTTLLGMAPQTQRARAAKTSATQSKVGKVSKLRTQSKVGKSGIFHGFLRVQILHASGPQSMRQ